MSLTEQRATRRVSRIRFVKFAVIALVLVGTVTTYLFWWSQPTAFGGYGNEIRGPIKVGQTFNTEMGSPIERVSMHHVRPVVVRNSADAKIEFVVCRYKIETRVGADDGSLDEYCSSVTPVDGRELRPFKDTSEAIIMRITPRRPGAVHVDGMNINYSRGAKHLWQTGDEQVGITIKLTAK